MCGIVGAWESGGLAREGLERMARSLDHRGPDDAGSVFVTAGERRFADGMDEAAVLGMSFRRLSILDLSPAGHQPMFNADRTLAIVYNGEVYNHRELRDELASRGYRFRSTSDTEVLLAMFETYGPGMLSRLNGMFAMAIYSLRDGTLFLARDRLGIKPLYHYWVAGTFLFASEAKAFFHHPSFHAELNEDRLSEQLMFRYTVGPDTLLAGVTAVEPGTYLLVRDGEPEVSRYWSIPPHAPTVHADEAGEQLEELLRSSVRYRLIADVGVGCQLSGGVDSSLIAWLAAEEHGELFDSVSVVFGDPAYSEEPYIDEVNASLRLAGHKTLLEDDFLFEQLERVTWHNDFPVGHPNTFGIYLLAAEARRHVTVLLSGEGADEVFGGYDRFAAARKLFLGRRLPGFDRLATALGRGRAAGGTSGFPEALSSFGDPGLLRKVCPSFAPEDALRPRHALYLSIDDSSPLERMLTYEQRTHLVDLLMRQDKMSMAHAIENRVPFLDHRIVEFAKAVPTSRKIGGGVASLVGPPGPQTKRLVKELASNHFGTRFVQRTKAGFALPIRAFFRNPRFTGVFERYGAVLGRTGLFEASAVAGAYERARAPQAASASVELLWILLMFAAWWEVFFEGGWTRMGGHRPSAG